MVSKQQTAEPAPKKAKTNHPNDKVKKSDDHDALCATAWEHFRAYLASMEDEDDAFDENAQEENGGGDTDELMAIRQLLLDNKIRPPKDDDVAAMSVKSCRDLLPVLGSVAAHLLADEAISEYLARTNDNENPICADQNNDNGGQTKDNNHDEEAIEEVRIKIHDLLEEAIGYFPWNAATWSMAANHGRMMVTNQPKNGNKDSTSNGNDQQHQLLEDPETVAQWYNHAVHCAAQVRLLANRLLGEDDDDKEKDEQEEDDEEEEDNGLNVKEWVETLLMNQVLGVEWIPNDDDDDDDEEKEEDLGNDEDDVKSNDDEEGGSWSSSAVEGTARFMAAMQYSTAGKHGEALGHLREFPLTHRLHPNVWKNSDKEADRTTTTTATSATSADDSPCFLFTKQDGVLPSDLYQRLCKVFEPTAPYWTESSYTARGYYSYFMDKSQKTTATPNNHHSNLIYEVIEDHLLPLVQKKLEDKNKESKPSDKEEICGYEWWVHHRPIGANLGHNLHFDTDEALLSQEGKVTHPVYSSVLYLTGENDGGATLVLDQTPDSKDVARRGWSNTPQNNTFLIFPGSFLHGVLPCSRRRESPPHGNKTSSMSIPRIADLRQENNGSMETSATATTTNKASVGGDSHRLTFMVGFWTRRVPDKMKEQKLYGPCGPMPPSTSEHSWVQEIEKGYGKTTTSTSSNGGRSSNVRASPVPAVSPVWEEFQGRPRHDKEDEPPALEIPHAIDHRFFVDGAPECFRASLFEEIECEVPEEEDE